MFFKLTVTVEISLFASKEKYAENEEVVNVTIRLDSELPEGVNEIPINYTTADGTASKSWVINQSSWSSSCIIFYAC